MGKKFFISVLTLLLITSGVYYFYWDNKLKNEETVAKKALNEYLHKERGFSKSDVEKVTFFDDNPLGGENYLYYYAYVVYADEPKNQYVYYITKEREVEFAGYAGYGDPDTMKYENYEELKHEKIEE
ncbi:DUF3139 domain-containing protein [Pseudobacillus sp. FSL P4-0506]|uniref:DUF3139 domain-containing protein n=1 Tax=Pseudobacillus sp. FSL P4-0506 TaxID=2921576 RepID=UPI0030F4FD2E